MRVQIGCSQRVSADLGRAQTIKGDANQPRKSSFGRQANRGGQRIKTIPCEFFGGDVSPDVAGCNAFSNEIADHVEHLPPRPPNLIAAMKEHRKLRVVVVARRTGHMRVGFEHCRKPPMCVRRSVASLCQVPEVLGNLPLVPSRKDGLDIGKVFVERCPSDTGGFRYSRHSDRPEAMLGDERCGGVKRRLPHRMAVCLDRLVPELGHQETMHRRAVLDNMNRQETWCIDKSG